MTLFNTIVNLNHCFGPLKVTNILTLDQETERTIVDQIYCINQVGSCKTKILQHLYNEYLIAAMLSLESIKVLHLMTLNPLESEQIRRNNILKELVGRLLPPDTESDYFIN